MSRTTSLLAARRPDPSDESGVALVMVVGSMLVLAMLAMAALAYTMSSQKFARYDQDFSASVVAAQSGVEDYVSRLNRNDTYAQTVDCSNVALRGPTTVTNTCGWNATTPPGWLPVTPGETDPNAAWFHYEADASTMFSTGTIMLTVTGRVHGVYRSTEVAVGKGGSTDYVYYTDFESADPSNIQAYSSTPSAACGGSGYSNAKYWYNGRSSASCVEITFVSGDVLDGSVFTNDAVLSSGALFKKGFLTAFPACSGATTNSSTWNQCLRSGSTANFNGVQPQKADPKYLDDTSAAFATHPGCHYFGSTRIIFNAAGTMTVWNKAVNNGGAAPIAIAPPGGSAPDCGTLTALESGATVAVPNEMVIYVAASAVTQRQCYAGEIGGAAGKTLPLGTYNSTKVAAPTASGQSYTVDTNMTESTKFCGQGNLYVEGTLKGRTTVAAAQSVVATGDLVLAGGNPGADMLGLVATNSVEVFHPRVGTVSSTKVNPSCTGSGCAYKWGSVTSEAEAAGWPTRYADPTTGTVTPSSGILIVGSIQTLQHSFLVQKYSAGPHQGDLTVYGSIAQRWRGIVGQSGASGPGYLKKYSYDTRLKYSAPPYFPKWADSQWSLRYSGEVNTSTAVRNSSP
jgi:Tfp pilus assembly protein PilX